MIFDKLTEQDKTLIQNYISDYATCDSNFCEKAELNVILDEWNTQKERLFHLFGDKFIISQKISYKESIEELNIKLQKALFDDPTNREFKRKILALYPYKPWEPDETEEQTKANEYHYIASRLFDLRTLRTNSYIGPNGDQHEYALPLPNKSYKFQNGTKPMKILKKLADAYDIAGFEHFRNAHSRCLQSKELNGELCFSIHPLDYMTMSDNDCGWSSCMSWKEYGDYRVGTVEMMNSPNVVVAYLKSDTTDYKFMSGTWNSKKWRCLFIVDENFIISVKSYPFYNEHLIKMVTTKLAELMGWGEIEPTQYDYDNETVTANNNVEFYLETDTIGMYNDFGHSYAHWVIVNPFVHFEGNKYCDTEYCYSGVPTCMSCGGELNIQNEGDESALTCGELDNYYYCDECGSRIRYCEDVYTVEKHTVCEDCFENYAVTDAFNDLHIFEENAVEVFLSGSNNKFTTPRIYYYNRSIWVSDGNIPKIKKMYVNYYFAEGVNQFHYDTDEEKYWIAPNELTDAGLDLFGIYSEQELKNYIADFE